MPKRKLTPQEKKKNALERDHFNRGWRGARALMIGLRRKKASVNRRNRREEDVLTRKAVDAAVSDPVSTDDATAASFRKIETRRTVGKKFGTRTTAERIAASQERRATSAGWKKRRVETKIASATKLVQTLKGMSSTRRDHIADLCTTRKYPYPSLDDMKRGYENDKMLASYARDLMYAEWFFRDLAEIDAVLSKALQGEILKLQRVAERRERARKQRAEQKASIRAKLKTLYDPHG